MMMGQLKSRTTVSERHLELIEFPSTFPASQQCAERSPIEHGHSQLERFNFEFAFEMPINAGRNCGSTGKLKVSAL
jgi:hypothetical protein